MEDQRKASFVYRLLGQLRFTCRQSLRLLIQVATPLKSLDYYRRYFVTVEQVTGTGALQSKDRHRTIDLCVVYSLLLAYFALFNLFHFFVPLNFTTRILLGDLVAALAMDAQFNLIFTTLSLYAIYINWAMYFKVDQNNITFLKSVFLNCESSLAVAPHSGADRKDSNRSLAAVLTKTVLNQRHAIIFQRFALLSINISYVFVLVLDLCLLAFTPLVTIIFFREQPFITFDGGVGNVRSWAFLLLLLTTFLFHAALNYLSWFSFAHGLILFAMIGTNTLTAIYLLFAEHYACLAKILAAMNKAIPIFKNKKMASKREAQLVGLLRHNADLFNFVFAGTAFYGWNFLLYMALHVPIAAIFSMEVLFDRHESADSSSSSSAFGLSQIVMVSIVCEAVVGTFLIHLYCAYYSKYLHRGGRMLLKWCGTNDSSVVDLSPRTQILVWVHLQRLWVRNKYGVTYGGLNLITIGTYFKVLVMKT